MDKRSRKTLRKIEQNYASLRELMIGRRFVGISFTGAFTSSDSEDYSRLGAAIGNNTHLTRLEVADFDESALMTVTNSEFFDGLKRNTSIHKLRLVCRNRIIVGGAVHEILKACQENNSHLTFIQIACARLQNGGDDIIANTLRRHTNLKYIYLDENDMTAAQLLPIIDTIRGGHHQVLTKLVLGNNNIGDAGCEAIATLLEDPNCNLRSISLRSNQIGDAGATILANSLSNKLQQLDLVGNSISHINDIFCGVLCNTLSINRTYSSNHALNDVIHQYVGPLLTSLLNMNKDTNKSHVAIKKILKYHPNIDMEPLFEWDAEDGEQNLKALPYVISWFDRAKVIVAANAEGNGKDNIDGKLLSAIYQFTMAMPTLFVPASHNKGGDVDNKKKRKRM